MATSLSKSEYLKRYMSKPSNDRKKDKTRTKLKSNDSRSRYRILDDDVDFKSLLPSNIHNSLDEDIDRNEPVIAGVIDERPKEVQQLEVYRDVAKWRTLTSNSEKSQKSPGGQKPNSYSNESPRKRHDSDSDQSPQRKQRHDSDSDQSPQRKQRHDSDSDQSPPRKQRKDSDSDQSPQRIQRHDSDSDQSPPRKKQHNPDSDQSPPRKHKHDPDSDQSPPRKQMHHSDSDQSPPRKQKYDSHTTNIWRDPHHAQTDKSERSMDSKGRATHTLKGSTAGLSSASDMKKEANLLRIDKNKAFNQIEKSVLGKDAKTVFRDKTGRHRNIEEEKNVKDAQQQELDEKYLQWGKGLKQVNDAQDRVSDALHEVSKPLARYRDDKDEMLKNRQLDGDPMLAFMKPKQNKNPESDKRRYHGNALPNRFGILPGCRWDGVDRSNGFEKKLFIKQSDRKAFAVDAYKWSIEDM